jgi:hypothetical protein
MVAYISSVIRSQLDVPARNTMTSKFKYSISQIRQQMLAAPSVSEGSPALTLGAVVIRIKRSPERRVAANVRERNPEMVPHPREIRL